jgi:hypothetical protein
MTKKADLSRVMWPPTQRLSVTAGFMWAPEMWNPAVANTATTSAWPSATAISAADASPPAATAFPEIQIQEGNGGSTFRRAYIMLAAQRRENQNQIHCKLCLQFTGHDYSEL